ncbi:MAG: STAS domain-containing protein [Erysipelotrichaceae bacterium]|nr:STAS domain-containing protein [Erysipelotrichaceae bacterium]
MKITQNRNDSQLVVSVSGRLDSSNADELEQAVSAIDGVSELIFDIAGLEYLSSAGLRVLLVTQRKMNRQGKMIVRGANETVRDIFDVTGFSTILTLE